MKILITVYLLLAVAFGARVPAGDFNQQDSNRAAHNARSLKDDNGAINQTRKLLQSSPDGWSPCLGADWTQLWSDEFSGPDIAPDASKWTPQEADGWQYGIGGWGNQELEYYTSSADNLFVQDGKLTIQARRETGDKLEWLVKTCWDECTARCQHNLPQAAFLGDCINSCAVPRCDFVRQNAITSGRIRSYGKLAVSPSDQFSTVRIEASIKLPRGVGLWPAFWMLPEQGARDDCMGCGAYGGWPASGELDIMESSGNMSQIAGTVFYGQEGAVDYSTGYSGPAIDGFQTFAVEWDAGQIRWYVDGNQYHSVDAASKLGAMGQTGGWYSTNAPGNAPFNVPFYIILNLAVGGMFPQADPAAVIADLSLGPKQMQVDYVRICGKPVTLPVSPKSLGI